MNMHALGSPFLDERISNYSAPYCIQYENETEEEKNCALFGFNLFYNHKNFGCDEGVKVTNLNGSSYSHALAESSTAPFKIGRFRFQSATSSFFTEKLSAIYHSADGSMKSNVIHILIDPYQQQSTISESASEYVVDGNAYFVFKIPPSSTVVIYVYPTEKVSLIAQLTRKIIGLATSKPCPHAYYPRAFPLPSKWDRVKRWVINLLSPKKRLVKQSISCPSPFGPEYSELNLEDEK